MTDPLHPARKAIAALSDTLSHYVRLAVPNADDAQAEFDAAFQQAFDAAGRAILDACRQSYTQPAPLPPKATMAETVAALEAREAFLSEHLPLLQEEHTRLTAALKLATDESAAVAETLGPLRALLKPGAQQHLLATGDGTPAPPKKRTAAPRKIPPDWVPEDGQISALMIERSLSRADVLAAAGRFRVAMLAEGGEYARWGLVFRAALLRGQYLAPAEVKVEHKTPAYEPMETLQAPEVGGG